MDWNDQTLLAPLTKGGNLPFRRLCVEFGATITMSEMAYARQVLRRRPSELALLRRHESEVRFGAQLAVSKPQDAVAAGQIAVDRGATFVDINAGCPIHDVVRRGMGVTLMRRPEVLTEIVTALTAALPVPVTVKIRAGWSESTINASEIAGLVEAAGAQALTIHPRSRQQRYTKTANWDLVKALVSERSIPVIGNGDIFAWYEAEARRQASGCAAVMIGRAALIKPWIFREIVERSTWLPTAEQRVAVYFRLTAAFKQHFREDEKGRERTMRFLPWHLDHLCRFRPIPDEIGRELAAEHPLIQTRMSDTGEVSVLERLLRDARSAVHERIATELWASGSAEDAVQRLSELAGEIEPDDTQAAELPPAQG